MFVVGPESAGAHPGPVCYRKNGYLAVTDANALLGRIIPDEFPKIFGPNEDEALDVDGARAAFEVLTKLPEAEGRSPEELAYGFLQVANEAMCRPIRNLTQMKGFDITTHVLACFGGAGGQHACKMAQALGISRVFVHRYGGVLSAYGLMMADAVHEEQEPAAETFTGDISPTGLERLAHLCQVATDALTKQGYEKSSIVLEEYLNMRYQGTDNAIMIQRDPDVTFDTAFEACYQREFGFVLKDRDMLIDDYRVRAVVPGEKLEIPTPPLDLGIPEASLGMRRAYFDNGWQEIPVYKSADLKPGHRIPGPGIIVQPISTVVLEIGSTASITANGDIQIDIAKNDSDHVDDSLAEVKEDPVQLSIFSHRFMGIAEQMGRTLQRTAISVNMKERLDFSCALFSKDGGLVANAVRTFSKARTSPDAPIHIH
jgi:5-oxoprolinase (ATP-hydrolysing)